VADDNDPNRSRTIKWEDPRPAARKAREMSGSEFFDQMRRGKISAPPFVHLLGMEVFDAGEGRFTMTLEPQECHYNPMGCVHGGVLSTLLDSVMSAAVHTALPAGKGYMTLEIKVNFIRPVFVNTGLVMAEGTVVSCGRHVATAEGKIIDVNGRLCSTGTATCLVFDVPPST
jgi:uncharacterized protein (TIGR00369 family)